MCTVRCGATGAYCCPVFAKAARKEGLKIEGKPCPVGAGAGAGAGAGVGFGASGFGLGLEDCLGLR